MASVELMPPKAPMGTMKLSVSVPLDLWLEAKRQFPIGDSAIVQLALRKLVNTDLAEAVRNFIES